MISLFIEPKKPVYSLFLLSIITLSFSLYLLSLYPVYHTQQQPDRQPPGKGLNHH
jgi:hypothetical protein